MSDIKLVGSLHVIVESCETRKGMLEIVVTSCYKFWPECLKEIIKIFVTDIAGWVNAITLI